MQGQELLNSIFEENDDVPTLEEIERRYGGVVSASHEEQEVETEPESKSKVGKKRGRKPKVDDGEMYVDKSSGKKKQKVEKINPCPNDAMKQEILSEVLSHVDKKLKDS